MTDEKNKPTPEELENYHTTLAKNFVKSTLQVLYLQGHKEFKYLTKSIETPEGGIYLLQIQHVTGPILDVQKFMQEPSKGEDDKAPTQVPT